MNDKEYTYDIDKYTIGVDTNGEDGIGMTVAKIENGEINFLGNCYGENARCIDLLIKENQELKKKYENAVTDYEATMFEKEQLRKQLEEYQLQNINLREDIMIQKVAFPNKLIKDKTFYNLYDMPTYEELLAQQKEFINYLEDNWKQTQDIWHIKILQKYKEIIGDDK